MRKFFERLFFYIGEIEIDLASLLMSGIIVILFLEVSSRYLLNNPLSWSQELNIFLMIWMVYMGAAYVTKIERHFTLDYFIKRLPVKINFWVNLFDKIIMIIFLVFAVWGGFRLRLTGAVRKSIMLDIPLNYYYRSIIVGGILMIAHLIYEFLKTIIDRKFIKKEGDNIAK